MDRAERQDSLLTKEMRRTLLGRASTNRDNQQKKNFETDIRERISNGLIDFQTLNKGLDRKDPNDNGTIDYDDLRIILDSRLVNEYGATENYKYDPESPNLPNTDPAFADTANAQIAVTHMVAFGYRSLRAIGNDPEAVMSNAIKKGVEMGEAKHKGISPLLVEADFSLETHEQAEADSLEKWNRDLPLSTEDRAELHEQLIEAVPEEVYQEATPMDFDDLVEEYLVSEE